MDIPTGEIEIFVNDLRILGKSETPPFEIVENCQTAEKLLIVIRVFI